TIGAQDPPLDLNSRGLRLRIVDRALPQLPFDLLQLVAIDLDRAGGIVPGTIKPADQRYRQPNRRGRDHDGQDEPQRHVALLSWRSASPCRCSAAVNGAVSVAWSANCLRK